MKSIKKVKEKLLPIIEARLQEGFYLSRGGLSAGFHNDEGGVCLAGIVCADRLRNSCFFNYRDLSAKRVGLSIGEWSNLESGFESKDLGRPLNTFEHKLVDLGAEIASTYGAIRET